MNKLLVQRLTVRHPTYLLEESGAHLKERFMMSVLHTQTPPHTHLGILGASTDIMRRGRWRNTTVGSWDLNVEKGSFTPLIYTTSGGWGPQAVSYHKRLAQLLSKKRNETYASVMNYMRTRIRFSILRSTLVAVRGERGKRPPTTKPLHTVSFNLVPEAMNYECF